MCRSVTLSFYKFKTFFLSCFKFSISSRLLYSLHSQKIMVHHTSNIPVTVSKSSLISVGINKVLLIPSPSFVISDTCVPHTIMTFCLCVCANVCHASSNHSVTESISKPVNLPLTPDRALKQSRQPTLRTHPSSSSSDAHRLTQQHMCVRLKEPG